MKPERLIALIAVLLVSQAYAAGYEQECNLQSAPKGAKITPSHGVDFISYPTELPAGYTGCSYMWLSDTRLFVSYYSNGRLVWLRGKEPKEQEETICFYESGKLNEGKSQNSGHCPSP